MTERETPSGSVENVSDAQPGPPTIMTGGFAAISIIVLVMSAVLPTDGLGFVLCPFNRIFDLPCPGCGLTRSITNITHGRWHSALVYNPMGYIAYGLFVFGAIWTLFPASLKGGCILQFRRQRAFWEGLTMITLGVAVLFGLVRLIFHGLSGEPFPTDLLERLLTLARL